MFKQEFWQLEDKITFVFVTNILLNAFIAGSIQCFMCSLVLSDTGTKDCGTSFSSEFGTWETKSKLHY